MKLIYVYIHANLPINEDRVMVQYKVYLSHSPFLLIMNIIIDYNYNYNDIPSINSEEMKEIRKQEFF